MNSKNGYTSIIVFMLALFVSMPYCPAAPAAGTHEIAFRHITTSDGLTNNNISVIFRDSKGFLWIGTEYGLNRSDAYRITQYFSDDTGLPSNHIWDIYEDFEGLIWVGCFGNYSYYDYRTNEFHNDVRQKLGEYGINVQTVETLGCKDEYLWVYDGQEMYLYDSGNSSLSVLALLDSSIGETSISGENFYYNSLKSGCIYSINIKTNRQVEVFNPGEYEDLIAGKISRFHVDREGGIWVYTLSNSLLLHKSKDAQGFQEIALPCDTGSYNKIADIDDGGGHVWIVTNHYGAFAYDNDTKTIVNHSFKPQSLHSLSSDNLTCVFVDSDNNVWLGSSKLGVSYHVPQSQSILNYSIEGKNDILSIHESGGTVLIGTDGAGVLQSSDGSGSFIPYNSQANVIVCIFRDSKSRIWLGSFQSGLVCIDGRMSKVFNTRNSGIAEDNIYGIREDADGNLWLALLGGKIQKFNPETGLFKTVHSDMDGFIRDIADYNQRTMFAATGKGLLEIDTRKEECHYVKTNYNGDRKFPEMYVQALYKDSGNILWMGTTNGVEYWNLQTDTIGHLGTEDGLPSNMITAFAEDSDGRMWIGTCKGLSSVRLKGTESSIQNYNAENGLASDDVNQRAMFRDDEGRIYVGSSKGYSVIMPKVIKSLTNSSSIIISGIRTQDSDSISFPFTDNKFRFRHNQLPITLEFSTLDFNDTDNISFEYAIGGGASEWKRIEGHSMTLPVSSFGKLYNIKVRTYNSDGILSPEELSFSIRIVSPWYLSRTAILLYFISAVGVIYLFFFLRHRKQERAMYLENLKRENDEKDRIVNMKLSFFANISHDFRTPLSLIINPLEEYIKKYPQSGNHLLEIVRKNASYLSELIEQLLSFRKIDAEGETMEYSRTDIVRTVHDSYLMYTEFAKKKNIKYAFTSQESSILVDCDIAKIRKIFHNLLSNAFKFTPDGGQILVQIQIDTSGQVVIKVSDSGEGIPDEETEKVFGLFYQRNNGNRPSGGGGSGIGLYLVSQYVKMHHGEVKISRNTPCGSIFTVSLPMVVFEDAVNAEDIPVRQESSEEVIASDCTSSHSVLLVDDNEDFLDFLADSLSDNYTIYKATDGKRALEILNDNDVDLVVSDVLMPEMNGLDLCRSIKSDINTSHIPVILLTAKAGDEFSLEGLNNGADDYITKPFNMEILRIKIEKFIENALKRHEEFKNKVSIEPGKITITPIDQKFIENAIQIVESNLNNSELSVEELAVKLNMSRGHLYRKLLKITGKAPLEFIRTIRMKCARQLLAESQMRVSEVAYLLGYNSPKLFTKHFKNEFHVSPSTFLRQQDTDAE